MRTKNQVLTWITVIVAVCGILYAISPMLLAYAIRQQLSAHGFHNIHVETGYPGYNHTTIRQLQFSGVAAGHQFDCNMKNLLVAYSPDEILHRRLASVHIPDFGIQIKPAPRVIAVSRNNIPFPVAAIMPSQWLAQLPVKKILLDKIHGKFERVDGIQHVFHISGHVNQTDTQLQGTISSQQNKQTLAMFLVNVNKHNKAELALTTKDKAPILAARVDTRPIQGGMLDINGKLTGDIGLLASLLNTVAPGHTPLPGARGHIHSQWHTQLDPKLPFQPDKLFHTLKIQGEATVNAQLDSIGTKLGNTRVSLAGNLQLEHGILHWKIQPGSTINSQVSLTGTHTKTKPFPLGIRLKEGASGDMRFEGRRILAQLNPGKLLSIDPLRIYQLSTSRSEVELKQGVQLLYAADTGKWELKPLHIALHAAPLHFINNRASFDHVTLDLTKASGEPSKWQGQGTITIAELKTNIAKHELSPGTLVSRFSIDSSKLLMTTSLSLASGAIMLKSNLQHEFKSGSGTSSLTLQPVTFSQSGLRLSKILATWPYPFDIDTGVISGKGSLSWKQTGSANNANTGLNNQTMKLTLKDLGGKFNDIGFAGLNNTLSLVMDKKIRSTSDSQVHIKLVDPGFPVRNIRAVYSFPLQKFTFAPSIRVKTLNAELLGGKARLDPFTFNLADKRNHMRVHLENIGLKEIMELEKQEGLSGSGVLDGSIPLDISDKGIEVHGGVLAARPPGGIIRYKPNEKVSALAKTNESIRLLTAALSNFQYSELGINSDYLPDGTLNMKVALKGRNPQWQSGRPVHLNLNLEENIPALLKSLQLGGKIEEQARKGYQKKK